MPTTSSRELIFAAYKKGGEVEDGGKKKIRRTRTSCERERSEKAAKEKRMCVGPFQGWPTRKIFLIFKCPLAVRKENFPHEQRISLLVFFFFTRRRVSKFRKAINSGGNFREMKKNCFCSLPSQRIHKSTTSAAPGRTLTSDTSHELIHVLFTLLFVCAVLHPLLDNFRQLIDVSSVISTRARP